MEAALHNLRPALVRLAGERVVVEHLVVGDETAVRLIRERLEAGTDAAGLVGDAIEIGARVLDREHAGANVEVVRAEMDKAAQALDVLFTERASAVAEQLAGKLDEAFAPEAGHFSRELARHFSDDSSGAVQHRVREAVAETMTRAREDLLRQFSSAEGHNPLAGFQKATLDVMKQTSDQQAGHARALLERMAALEKELQRLRDEREAQLELAAEREKGTAKGRSYEEAVYEAVEQIAAGADDCAQPVGDLPGTGGRKGDAIVAIEGAVGPARGFLVFEAKDRREGRKKALAELDAALDQRAAQFGVWVVPSVEELPAGVRDLREVDGNKLFVVFSPEEPGGRAGLELAYKLARARVLLARTEVEGLDADALSDRVELARRALEDVRRIKGQLTAATTGIGAAREAVDALAVTVRQHLDEIDDLLTATRAG